MVTDLLRSRANTQARMWPLWFSLITSAAQAQPAFVAVPADEDAAIEAVVKERMRHGNMPSLGVPGDHFGEPVQEICLGLPGGGDPSDSLLARFGAPYRIVKVSDCSGDMLLLIVGPVRWVGRDKAEVDWSGLGNQGTYRVERQGRKWKALGAIGGLVS